MIEDNFGNSPSLMMVVYMFAFFGISIVFDRAQSVFVVYFVITVCIIVVPLFLVLFLFYAFDFLKAMSNSNIPVVVYTAGFAVINLAFSITFFFSSIFIFIDHTRNVEIPKKGAFAFLVSDFTASFFIALWLLAC